MSEPENVRRYFIRSAEAFDSLYAETRMNPLTRFINRHLRRDIYERYLRTLEHVKRHNLHTALDVGCGSGRYEVGLAELGIRRVVGVDFSHQMIDLAGNYTAGIDRADERFEFVCADFNDFQAEETFDLVFAMGFWDYIRDPLPVLKKMKALAGHSVLGSFPSVNFYRTPIRKLRYWWKDCPVYFYRADRLDDLAAQAGFARHEVSKIKGAGQDYFVTFFK